MRIRTEGPTVIPVPDASSHRFERGAEKSVTRIRCQDRKLAVPLGHLIGNPPRNKTGVTGVRLNKSKALTSPCRVLRLLAPIENGPDIASLPNGKRGSE